MGIWELIIIAVGLSMDAFAVAVCKGLSVKKVTIKHVLIVGLYFGFFQGIMPLIGYFIGFQFSDMIVSVDHWIAFGLLLIIGGKMIFECFKKEGCPDIACPKEAVCTDRDCPAAASENKKASLKYNVMLLLALATSIDALAVGVSFAFLKIDIITAVALIGGITFILSALGTKAGSIFGTKLKSKAEFIGGIILILMGVKILLEHLGIF